jgi:hypothetical protein
VPLPTSVQTLTFTPLPTLGLRQLGDLIVDVIKNNGGCELPCWWGNKIVVGSTSDVEANRFLAWMGPAAIVSDDAIGVDIPPPPSPSFQYSVDINLKRQNNIVHLLNFHGTTNGKPNPQFSSDWRAHYAWDQVMGRNGPPSQIRLALFPRNSGGPAFYSLFLFYDKLGMAIWYVGPAQDISQGVVRACPRFDLITEIRLSLVPAAYGSTLTDLLLPSGKTKTLSEATGMSVQTFYEMFGKANGQGCFEGLPTPTP